MANLLSSLVSSASALAAYDQVLQVSQNNVANASTPGFVRHRQTLLAMQFDPAGGLAGGVRAGEVLDIVACNADRSWYRLSNGRWIYANLVGNAPRALQVVP